MTDERIIEGRWPCSTCHDWVLGRYKQCPNDGNPREEGTEMDFTADPAASPTVTDPELLHLANAGPDVFCPYCQSGNIGTGSHCRNCGADLTANDPSPQRPALVDLRGEAPPWTPLTSSHVEPLRPDPWWLRLSWLHYSVGALGLALAILLVWGFSTHEVLGECSGKGWTRSATRETWRQVVAENWKLSISSESSQMPVNGSGERAGAENIRECHPKVHHYNKVQTGTRTEHYTASERYSCGETCSSKKNGFMSCRTKYCSRSVRKTRQVPVYREDPVYRTWCTYDTWEWNRGETRVTVGTVPGGGDSEEELPVWPKLDPGPLDRVLRTESYQVHITYPEDQVHHEVLSRADYDSWHMKDPAWVTVSNFGSVQAVKKHP